MNRHARRALTAIGLGKKSQPQDGQAIQNEYYKKCAQAGELQYKIKELSNGLAVLNNEIKQLNKKYADFLEAEEARARKEAKQKEEAASVQEKAE